jgi:alanyl aminopeptidase
MRSQVLTAVLLLAVVVGLVACPGDPPPPPPRLPPVNVEPKLPPPEVQTNGRLPSLATPLRYGIDLDIDPTKERFSGVVRIEVEVPQKTSFIVLHGHALEITAARADLLPPNPAVPARASTRMSQGGKFPEELVLEFAKPLPPGKATLAIEYTAPFDNELSGIYRVKDGELSYAFTQFESTDARRAFPCFDEPGFKVPFDLSITVPQPMIAVANTPETMREPTGTGGAKTRFRFAPTQPLPTYLVALAVGELEIKDATRFTKPPIRIVTTKGKTAMSALALEATGAIVDALGQWFGIPYPYEKLDIVAVPEFAPGAMENPGLVTFREERLLLDPARSSVVARRGQALIIAHELAHQWFGDLVTASWWNDIWLNEGMATWMEWRVVDKWRPQLGARIDAVVSAHNVMDLDGLVAARAVRQPVVSTSDAHEAFDGITYEKGAAVLSTIERWIGEEAFQRGVREYLKENSWKSVQADRLLSALDKASGKDVTQMASPYLDKPGVPEVSAKLECEPGGRWHMDLSSQQWRPLGSKVPAEDGSAFWTIPVCVRAQGDKKDTCADLVMGAPSIIAARGACPAFVHPNVGSSYYRVAMSEKEVVGLAENRKSLDVPARISLLSNAWAAVRSGQLEPKAMLRVLPAFDEDNSRQVVDQIVNILYGMSETVVDPEARVAFRKFALTRLAKRKKTLGFLPPAKGDASSDDTLARRSVLFAMGDVAEDDATLKEAEDVATKWLADPTSVDSDSAGVALDLASRKAGEARVTALFAAVKSTKAREDRIIALRALVGFDDEDRLKQALDLTLTDDIHANEMRYVIAGAFSRRVSRPIAEAWVRAHWDDLRKKLPGSLSRVIVRAAAVGCSQAEADERAEFYTPRVAAIEGAGRALASSLESISLCMTLRAQGSSNLRKALLGTKK